MSKSQTLEQQAYNAIKKRVIAGTYKPGSHLTEAMLVEDLQMSRTPIRRALGKLESEGILSHQSHHGSVVKNVRISMQELINLIEIRNIFAIVCIQKAERRQMSFEIADMHDCIETMEWAYEHEKAESYYNGLTDWNNLILSKSHNNLIMEVSEELYHRFTIGSSVSAFQLRKQGIPRTLRNLKKITEYLEEKRYSEAIDLLNSEFQESIKDLIL